MAWSTGGNDEWEKQQALQRQRRSGQSYFPAANQPDPSRNTAFAHNAPINTLGMNLLNQIPVGGFGLGALSNVGYSRSPQFNLDTFRGGGGQPSQPTMTGYHWQAGTGGVSGGNNANMDVFYNNGTRQNISTNIPGQLPQSLPNLQYTLPGVNADARALSDPSVGALDTAQRSTNQFGQNVINPAGGGQIISGRGPSYGALAGSTQSTNAQGQQVLNTPSGGQAIGGPSLRKPMQKLTPGDTYSLGGWY